MKQFSGIVYNGDFPSQRIRTFRLNFSKPNLHAYRLERKSEPFVWMSTACRSFASEFATQNRQIKLITLMYTWNGVGHDAENIQNSGTNLRTFKTSILKI